MNGSALGGVSRTVETPGGTVSVRDEGPDDPAGHIVLAHGAGAGMESDFMTAVGAAVSSQGWRVRRFNFPYIETQRRRPDPARVLEGAFVAVLDDLGADPDATFVGGKSLGGRIASHVVAAGRPVAGLVFLGYPLHPPGRPDRMRDEHLRDLTTPMLFVEGTRDPFCPLETLREVTQRFRTRPEIVVVEDGDHSLKVRASSGRSTRDAWQEAATAVVRWAAAQRS